MIFWIWPKAFPIFAPGFFRKKLSTVVTKAALVTDGSKQTLLAGNESTTA